MTKIVLPKTVALYVKKEKDGLVLIEANRMIRERSKILVDTPCEMSFKDKEILVVPLIVRKGEVEYFIIVSEMGKLNSTRR